MIKILNQVFFVWKYFLVPVDIEEIQEDIDDSLPESFNLEAFHLEKVKIKFLILLDLQPSYKYS